MAPETVEGKNLRIFMKRIRKIHGRVKVEIDGEPWRVEMRKDGVWLHRKHSRQWTLLSFLDLHTAATGQKLLPL
jgi:hypothetical protein